MSWIKRKLRKWLYTGDEISIPEDRPYALTAGHNPFGESAPSTLQLFNAINGRVLVIHTPTKQTRGLSQPTSGTAMYVLKDDEDVVTAAATLLTKARLDSL